MDENLGVLDRFVIRARRVEAHSLAQDRRALADLGKLSLTGTIGLDGNMSMRRTLPNEELFESLAARVRPLLLKTESIHYRRVLDALDEHVAKASLPEEADAMVREGLAVLRTQWSQFDTDTANILSFAVQSSSLDGTDVTPQVSDTQLAAAWLYGDVVHVDVKGKKSAGQLLPVKERFSAAVMYFALVADLTLSTLEATRRLHELGALNLDDRAFDADVVVGTDELIQESTAYFAPLDTPMPEPAAGGGIPEGFKPFTVVDLLRQNPSDVVGMVLEDAQGAVIANYDGAVSDRAEVDGRYVWTILIDNVTEIRVSFQSKDGYLDDIRLEELKTLAFTNKMLLADAVLQQEIARSTVAKFTLAESPFFNLGLPSATAEALRTIDISVDALCDVVLIEQAIGTAQQMFTGSISRDARVNLRRARLLWEGELVRYTAGPVFATTEVGTTPEAVYGSETSFAAAGVTLPYPTFLLRNPDAVVTSRVAVPQSEPPTEQILLTAPAGQVFSAWAPGKRLVPLDDDLTAAVGWDLSHFDEDLYLFGT